MTTTQTTRNPRENINHGHNQWDGEKWVPEYLTWCGVCREKVAAAKAAK